MKRIATIQIPEGERTLCLRSSPQWTRISKAADHAQQGSAKPSSSGVRPMAINSPTETAPATPNPPPAHVEGKWSRRIWTLKHQLDHPPYVNMWNVYKQYTNDYERIHVSSNRSRVNDNVAAYLPLSRSYFKMWELLKDFGLLGGCAGQPSLANTSVRTAHLAEGPGGFIEAVCRFRKATATNTARQTDRYYGITLKPTRRDVPGWSKSIRLLREYTQIHRHHGADGSGCLYKIANIHRLVRDVGRNSCTLVTGDGGIDFSVDFALQEPLSLRLLTAQIYAGLLLLHPGKAFVCKFFDMHEPATHELLWILATAFDKIHIVKPATSRLANSERYIVGVGYRGCPEPLEKLLCATLMQWRPDYQLVTIMQAPVPPSFLSCITAYNEWYAEQQHRSIQACLRLIDMAVATVPQEKHTSDETESLPSVKTTGHTPLPPEKAPSMDSRNTQTTDTETTDTENTHGDRSGTDLDGHDAPDTEPTDDDGWNMCVSRKRRSRARATAAPKSPQAALTEVGGSHSFPRTSWESCSVYDDTGSVPPHRLRRRPTQNASLEAELVRTMVQQRESARKWCEKYGVEMV